MRIVAKLLLVLFVLVTGFASAQNVTIKGAIRDDRNQRLPQAHVILLPDSVFGLTNSEGNFVIQGTKGDKRLQISFVGYELFDTKIMVLNDTALAITLQSQSRELDEIVITSTLNRHQEIFDGNQTSKYVLTQEDVNAIPVLGGEADVIKTIQLLPGTVRGIEGSSDLFVRGGAADQNLVLLDGATIYNTSHLFGFLSVFNADVLDRVEAINGGFPAQYGGRLSSILNVHTRSLIPERTAVSGDIGLIASRLFVEQPIIKNKASFWIAARRTYIDQMIRAVGEELPYYFYDLNGKFLLKPTARDNFEFSHYSGDDILDLFRDRDGDGDGFLTTYSSGNSSQSLSWKRQINNEWFSTLTLARTKYHYNIRNVFEENELLAHSDIEDYSARLYFEKDSLGRGTLRAGFDWIRHQVSPNIVNTAGTIAEVLESSIARGRVADEFAAHLQYEWSPDERIQVNPGIRISSSVVRNKNYLFPEPRLSVRYALNPNEALKFSYSRMVQYMHRISNSAVSSPTDIWYPVTDSIRPQTSHQFALAWQRQLTSEQLFLSVEGYYKQMDQLIGYEEGTNLFLNTDFESKLIQGKGKAYGFEFLLRKNGGKLTGWISYTLSWSHRQFDGINSGLWFPSRYDRRHNGAIVAQYAFSKRWAASLVWEYISGSRFTPVIGQYAIIAPTLTGADLIPVYSGINEVKLAASHRLDIGLKFKSSPDRKFQWQWFAGVYNVYNRANPIGINIEQDEVDKSLRYTQPGLFGLLPFLSYGFKF
jgi:outer membrane cobalamin receptor